MVTFLEIREKLKAFYGKYGNYLLPVIKFIFVLVILLSINHSMGYMSALKSLPVVLIVSLASALLPVGAIVFIVGAFLLAHFYTLSLELAMFTFILLLLMFCTYYVFKPGNSIVLLLLPLLFTLKIPYLMPITLALVGGISGVIPISFGVIIYYLIRIVITKSNVLTDPNTETLQKLTSLIETLITDKEMIVVIIIFSAAFLIVYLLRRLSMNYAWQTAIGAGCFTMIIFMLAGRYMIDKMSITVVWIIIGTLLSGLLAMGLQMFIFTVDYTRTEYTQFEDDNYYYYVKAVPKITVTAQDVKIKKINIRQSSDEAEDTENDLYLETEYGHDEE